MLNEILERRARQPLPPAIAALLVRAQREYLEMPGLKLTEAQARRLWGLDRDTCSTILATLIRRGFLRRSRTGAYVRAN
jgi:hypothetical protein